MHTIDLYALCYVHVCMCDSIDISYRNHDFLSTFRIEKVIRTQDKKQEK